MSATDSDLESLREERAFLLRSLADLDAEHEAGDIEDDDYRSLTDDYTARAAAVLRAMRALPGQGKAGRSAVSARVAGRGPAPSPRRTRPVTSSPTSTPTASPTLTPTATATTTATAMSRLPSPELRALLARRRRWRTIAVIGGVFVFGGVAAWAVSRSSGTRQAGQTISGNNQLTQGSTVTRSTVTGGVDQRLIDAATLVNQGKVADALKLYDTVLKDDPNQPVALADGGWLEAQAGLAANRTDLVDTGLVKIVKAEKSDPAFADAHFFRGFLLLRAKNDAPGAVTELRLYLGTVNPASPQVASVQRLLAEAIKAAGPNVPPGPNAPATSTTPPTSGP